MASIVAYLPGEAYRQSAKLAPYVDTLASIMLTSLEREILDFEQGWWKLPGPKEWAIQAHFGLDAGTYYRRLGDLIWNDNAERHDPMTVRRLRRLIGPGRVGQGRS